MLSQAYYDGQRTELAFLLPEEYSTVLEVGCGEGGFSKNLKPECTIWGCEPNTEAAKRAEARLSRVLVGTYEAVADKIPDRHFDLIVCNDVIEHMQDHDWFFRSIRSKMTSAGALVGSIPNVRHIRTLYRLLVKKDWQYEDSMTLDRTHLRFFTQKSLLRTFSENGFDVERFVGINGTRRPFNHALLFLFNLATLWQHRDVEHLQFAFRLRLMGSSP